MAKKKDEDTSDVKRDHSKEIIESYGSILFDSSTLLDTKQEIVSVSPAIDNILNGGIPKGTYVTITGKEKTGKTTTILQIIANAQKIGMRAFYHDAEHRLKKMNISGVPDLKPFEIIRSTTGKILNSEDHLTIMQKTFMDCPNSVVVMDSWAALVTDAETKKDLTGSARSDAGKLLSDFFKKTSPILRINNIILIGVNHLYANTSGYGSAYLESGSSKSRYYADIRLRVTKMEPWESGGIRIGQLVSWSCDTSALGPPGGDAISAIRYGKGIDAIYEMVNIAIELGLIEKAAAWLKAAYLQNHVSKEKWGDEGKEFKAQGMENMIEFLRENLEYAEILRKEILSMTCGIS